MDVDVSEESGVTDVWIHGVSIVENLVFDPVVEQFKVLCCEIHWLQVRQYDSRCSLYEIRFKIVHRQNIFGNYRTRFMMDFAVEVMFIVKFGNDVLTSRSESFVLTRNRYDREYVARCRQSR